MELTRRLTLEAPVRAPDGVGGFGLAWEPVGTVWAHVTAARGRPVSADGQDLGTVRHDVTVRAAPVGAPSRPRPAQRFVEGGRAFRILSVAEADATGRYLTCQTIEGDRG